MPKSLRRLLVLVLLMMGVMTARGQSSAGFPLPPLDPISAANAAQIVELARIGRGAVQDTAWSPSGDALVVATTLGVWLYDSQDWTAEPRLFSMPFGATRVAFRPDGAHIAAGSDDGSIHLWTREGELWGLLEAAHLYRVTALAFNGDATQLASGDLSGVVHTWDLATGTSVRSEQYPEAIRWIGFDGDTPKISTKYWQSPGYSAFFSQNAQLLLRVELYMETHELTVTDIATLNTRVLDGYYPSLSSIGFPRPEPDETLGAFYDGNDVNNAYYVFDPYTGNLLSECRCRFSDEVCQCSVSGDDRSDYVFSSRLQAFGGNDGIVRVRNYQSGDEVGALFGHIRAVNGVDFDSGGTLLASASSDGTIRLWDATRLDENVELAVLTGHNGGVMDVAFNGDGTLLASTGFDGTVRLWGVPSAGE